MSHTCHAPECKTNLPPRMFACRRHWFMLPQKYRDAIWRYYRPGQENDKKPSLEYLIVSLEAQKWIGIKEGTKFEYDELLNTAKLKYELLKMGKEIETEIEKLVEKQKESEG